MDGNMYLAAEAKLGLPPSNGIVPIAPVAPLVAAIAIFSPVDWGVKAGLPRRPALFMAFLTPSGVGNSGLEYGSFDGVTPIKPAVLSANQPIPWLANPYIPNPAPNPSNPATPILAGILAYQG